MKKTFVIAEIGINHNGNMKIASNLIKKAKLAGADAVKFQTYITDILVKKDEPKMQYQKVNDKISAIACSIVVPTQQQFLPQC